MAEQDSFSIDQLARLSGEPVGTLRAWATLGLLSGDNEAGFDATSLERVRLIEFAGQRGIDPEAIAAASSSQGDMLGRYVENLGLSERGPVTCVYSLGEAAEKADVDKGLFERLWVASGLRDQGVADDEDVEAIRCFAEAIELGMPEGAMLQIARVSADALGKVAEATSRLFHYYVHERLRAEGLTGAELVAATESVSQPLTSFIEPSISYFHHKAWARALREDLVLHLAECCPPPVTDAPGSLVVTVLFVDLASFTAMTEAMGDVAAVDVVERFSDLVHDSASRWRGKVVKQIGDEFMVVFSDGRDALRCGIEIEARCGEQPMFPAVRLGAHNGPVLYRQADYVGATVNLAARVASVAGPHQFLVTAAVREQAKDLDVSFATIGRQPFKGISNEVDLFEVPVGEDRPARAVDPVCGMQLDSADIRLRLSPDHPEVAFCSEACLKRYVAAPEKFSDRSKSRITEGSG
jgi:class 3 adenylate cyclase/YHS domain-containing protein